jgi:hypothetical protein
VDLFWNAILALKTSSESEEEREEHVQVDEMSDANSMKNINVTFKYANNDENEVLQDENLDYVAQEQEKSLKLLNKTETIVPLD